MPASGRNAIRREFGHVAQSAYASRRQPGDGDGSTMTLMVVPGNPALQQRCRDDDARPSWPSPSSIGVGIVGGSCVIWLYLNTLST